MRDETFDKAARSLASSRRNAMLGGLGLALASMVGSVRRSSAAAKKTHPEFGVSAPVWGAGGVGSEKKKKKKVKTIPVSRCNCYQDGSYVYGQGVMFCYYETPTIPAEEACVNEALVCARLASACRSAQASACIGSLVNRWS